MEKKRPEPPPRTIPPLDIIEDGEFVDLSKSEHVYLTDDGKIGVPKGTRTKRTKTPPIPAPLEPTKKSITTPKKKRKKKKMSFDIFDFDRLKALYYLISIIFAVFVIVLMCLENPNIIWIVLCIIGPVTSIILKIID
ncbi:MAG: hypothetical protein MJZ79_04065 [Paludibacteraceae bacterium]|nr:hypothetical protein [Paludibacteraceae bacterium]